MNSKKIFPINNEAACVWKWSWNTFRLFNGKTSSCHRVQQVFVPLDEFDNFHNTKEVINDRQLMLSNQWPTGRGCEYCKNIEAAGGFSDRNYHNAMENLTPVDFDSEKNNINVTPRVLEVYLNNTCDLACLYCIPNYSSKINDELRRFGPLSTIDIKPVERIPDHVLYLEKLLSWLEKNSKSLQRFTIQGGEPFLQPEFEKVMQWLENSYNPDLELTFNTNLNEKAGIIDGYVERLRAMLIDRKVKRVDFTCSIDCWGPQQEFVRYGLQLERWQRNFEYLLKNPWLHIHTGHTVTALTIKTLPELLKKITNYKNQGHRIYQTFGHVDGKNQLLYDPVIFGREFFAEDLSKALAAIPSGQDRDRLHGIVKRIENSTPDRSRQSRLYATLNQIDQRRNTDWKSLFPEIYQHFIENEIPDVVQ